MKLLPITQLLIERTQKVDVLLLRAEWAVEPAEADRFTHFAVLNYEMVQELREDLTKFAKQI